MARPKRMGAYNGLDDLPPGPHGLGALDDLLPGPRRPVAVDDPPSGPRGPLALDDLLPGPPGPLALDDLLPGPRAGGGGQEPPPGRGSSGAPGQRPGAAARRPRGAGRHLAAWNPLDDLPPGSPPADPGPPPVDPGPSRADPGPPPARARVSFRLPADLVEAARDAVAQLAGTADRTTLTGLAERALRAELARLAAVHRNGRPFPPRGSGLPAR